MKIRHKQTGEVVEGVDEGMGNFLGFFYRDEQGHHKVSLFLRPLWEPVPEEVWEDVTAECLLSHDGHILSYPSDEDEILSVFQKHHYRLRRATLIRKEPYGADSAQTAFLIERKRPA